jgi:uncharacterized protein YndB with AHSA1/START domain
MKNRLLSATQIAALKNLSNEQAELFRRGIDGHRELEKLIGRMRTILLAPLETLAACALFAVVVVPATGADIELPAIVVTGRETKPPDIVSRDRDQRSPDIHWPADLSLRWSEMFAHNEIEINAPLAAVWNHLVRAQLWPQWFPDCGNVRIKDGSQILQKNTRFTWSGFDLPRYNRFESFPPPLDSKVVEYVPESRIGWVSYATSIIYGPLCDSYHAWLLTPTGARKCQVIFEEVATGFSAQHTRAAYPEILHRGHQRWLEQLKRISKSRTSKALALGSQF